MNTLADDKLFSVVSSDGARIGCVVDGSGPPLLMIHGTGDTQQGWRRMRPLLASSFRLYMMDRRGRGVSGDRDRYSLEQEWDDVAALIDAFSEPVDVFAHSFGGLCALEGALRARPGQLRRMVIYEPSVNRMAPNPPRERAVEEMGRLISQGDRDAVTEMHLRAVINVPDEIIARQRAQADAWAGRVAMAHTMPRELLALRAYHFAPSRFAAIRSPTRLLVGQKSAPHAFETARRLEAALPDAELALLEGQAHFAMLTGPELLASKITEFLKARASHG